MTTTRHAALLACAIAVLAPASSLARDPFGTGLPAQTLSTLELDAGFGRRGEVRSAARGGIRFTAFDRVALDPSGRIVVAGSGVVRGSVADRPCVARFLADGRLDRSFAGGVVALPVRGGLGGLAVDAEGRIVVCGRFRGLAGTKRAATTFIAARLRADGRIDREFGDDGLAEADISDLDHVQATRIDPRDGSILALVQNWRRFPTSTSGVVRFTAAGEFDTTFGTDGFPHATTDALNMAIDDRGGVIVGGSPTVRLGPDGVRDMTFGIGGVLKGPLGHDVGGRVQIDGHGRILLFGNGDRGGSAMFRYLPDGALDPSFDGDGRSPVPLAVPRYYSAFPRFIAASPGDADRYVLLAGLDFLDLVAERGIAYPAGTGYIVQAVDPSNLGALSAFVHSDSRPVERAERAMSDVVVTPDGSAALVVGSETVGPRGHKRRTPLLFRVDLTPREAVALPDFHIEWTAPPTLTATGPHANGYFAATSAYKGLSLRVTNSGATDLAGATVMLLLSEDDRPDAGDLVLGYGVTGTFAAGATMELKLSGGTDIVDPNFTGLAGRRVIAMINPDGGRPESDTTNNVAVSDPLPSRDAP